MECDYEKAEKLSTVLAVTNRRLCWRLVSYGAILMQRECLRIEERRLWLEELIPIEHSFLFDH
jgi:hypothetical protein